MRLIPTSPIIDSPGLRPLSKPPRSGGETLEQDRVQIGGADPLVRQPSLRAMASPEPKRGLARAAEIAKTIAMASAFPLLAVGVCAVGGPVGVGLVAAGGGALFAYADTKAQAQKGNSTSLLRKAAVFALGAASATASVGLPALGVVMGGLNRVVGSLILAGGAVFSGVMTAQTLRSERPATSLDHPSPS